MTAHPAGALALRVASDALSHDAALKPEWKVPDGLRKDMERAADDLRALIAERDALKSQAAALAKALGRADWFLAAWLSGDSLESHMFDSRGWNAIQAAHAEANLLLGDAGAAKYAPMTKPCEPDCPCSMCRSALAAYRAAQSGDALKGGGK